MTLFLAGLVLFLGIHAIRVVAPGFRQAMIGRLGLSGWKGVYAIVSLAGLVLLVMGWADAKAATGMIWYPPTWLAHISLLLMAPALVILVSSQFPAGHIRTKTKHPMVLSVKIWALAHLLANGETVAVILFGAFLAWGVIMRIAYKRRERAGEAVLPRFVSARWDIVSLVVGLGLYVVFVLGLHEWLFGVAPVAMG